MQKEKKKEFNNNVRHNVALHKRRLHCDGEL